MNDKYTDEIRAIRDRQYEETKNMTPEEMEKYTNSKIKDILKELDEPYVPDCPKKQPVHAIE